MTDDPRSPPHKPGRKPAARTSPRQVPGADGALILDQDFDAGSLYPLRGAVAAHTTQAGMPESRAGDIVLAVHELAVNAIRHGAGHGRLLITAHDGALLLGGSRLAAGDVSAAMLARLTAAGRGHAFGAVPLLAAAEQLPLRAASLDVVTAFNCVHHFDLGRFLTAARVLAPVGQPVSRASQAPSPARRAAVRRSQG